MTNQEEPSMTISIRTTRITTQKGQSKIRAVIRSSELGKKQGTFDTETTGTLYAHTAAAGALLTQLEVEYSALERTGEHADGYIFTVSQAPENIVFEVNVASVNASLARAGKDFRVTDKNVTDAGMVPMQTANVVRATYSSSNTASHEVVILARHKHHSLVSLNGGGKAFLAPNAALS
jgi:hypothetical protein